MFRPGAFLLLLCSSSSLLRMRLSPVGPKPVQLICLRLKLVLKQPFIRFSVSNHCGAKARAVPGGNNMTLRKFIIGLTITAFASFAGLGIQQFSAQGDLLAGAGHWVTDNDVG